MSKERVIKSMKRMFIIFLAFVFLFGSCSSVLAIDKKKAKPLDPKETPEKIEPKSRPVSPPQKQAPPKQLKPDNPKDFNDFVDKNNNGIDDRVERKRKSAREKEKIEPKSDKSKPAPPPKSKSEKR
jgi:hypothetical protein